MDLIKEFRAAGLISKKLAERVVFSSENAPQAVNPAMPQNLTPTTEVPAQTAPQPAPEAAQPEQMKSQQHYLFNSAMAAMKTAEACMEAICEGKCFESMTVDPTAMTEMQTMLSAMKEWKAKMEQFAAPSAANPATPAGAVTPQQQAADPAAQVAPAAANPPQASTQVTAPPSPITGSTAA